MPCLVVSTIRGYMQIRVLVVVMARYRLALLDLKFCRLSSF